MPGTTLYVAADAATAADGASRLDSRLTHAVEPASSLDAIRAGATEADCVVFAETPTSTEGAHLLEVIDVCESTPLILFSERDYGPATARATEGVDGYVRRAGEDRFDHLADEIEWRIRGGRRDPNRRNEPLAVPPHGATCGRDEGPIDSLVEFTCESRECSDVTALLDLASETVRSSLDADAMTLFLTDLSDAHGTEFTIESRAMKVRSLESNEGLAGRAYETGEGTIVNDVEPDILDAERYESTDSAGGTVVDSDDSADESGVDHGDSAVVDSDDPTLPGVEPRSVLAVPIDRDAVVLVGSSEPGAFEEENLPFVELLGTILLAEIGRRRLAATLEETQECHDETQERLEETQEHLHEAQKRLSTLVSTRERHETLFGSFPHPIAQIECREERPIVRRVNSAFEERFGVDRTEIVGEDLHDAIVPHQIADETTAFVESLRTGEPLELVTDRRTADRLAAVRIDVVPFSTADPPEGFICYRDVTDRVRAERERIDLRRRHETLATSLEAELRPPLNVARGYLELASETGDDEHFEEVDEALVDALESLDTCDTVVSRESTITVEPVAVYDVARRAWAMVKEGATTPADGNATLELDGDAILEADEELLTGILEALYADAIDRADERVTIRVGATGEGLFVEDDVDLTSVTAGGFEGVDASSGLDPAGRFDTAGGLDASGGVTASSGSDTSGGIDTNSAGDTSNGLDATGEIDTSEKVGAIEMIAAALGWGVRCAPATSGGRRIEFVTPSIETDEQTDRDVHPSNPN